MWSGHEVVDLAASWLALHTEKRRDAVVVALLGADRPTRRQESTSVRSAAAQKLEVAAFDQGGRVVDETIGFAPRVRVLPFDRGELGLI